MESVALVGLLKIELADATVRLCDGGIIKWGSETFTAKDPLFGTIASLSEVNEGVGEEVPAFEVTFNPPETSLADDLASPGYQTSRVSVWIAEYNPATGSVTGTPTLMFLGQLDQIELGISRDSRDLGTTVVSFAERLFNRNEGNSLSEAFHKSVWPGETGMDAANGLSITVAWGAESAGQGYIAATSPWGRQWVQGGEMMR